MTTKWQGERRIFQVDSIVVDKRRRHPVSAHQTCVANTKPAQALDRAVAAPVYDMDKARVAGAATPFRQS